MFQFRILANLHLWMKSSECAVFLCLLRSLFLTECFTTYMFVSNNLLSLSALIPDHRHPMMKRVKRATFICSCCVVFVSFLFVCVFFRQMVMNDFNELMESVLTVTDCNNLQLPLLRNSAYCEMESFNDLMHPTWY